MEKGAAGENESDRSPQSPALAYYRIVIQDETGGSRAFIVAARNSDEAGRLVREFGTPTSIEARTAPRPGSGLPRIVSASAPRRQVPARSASGTDRHGMSRGGGKARTSRNVGLIASPSEDLRGPAPLRALHDAGCIDVIVTDRNKGPAGLAAARNVVLALAQGDVLVTPRLDALGCSVRELAELVELCAEKQVWLCSVGENLDTRAEAGQLYARIIARLADMEKQVQSYRTRAGLSAAGRHGRRGGRPLKMTEQDIATARRLLAAPGASLAEVAAEIGVSRSTLYRALSALGRGANRDSADQPQPPREE